MNFLREALNLVNGVLLALVESAMFFIIFVIAYRGIYFFSVWTLERVVVAPTDFRIIPRIVSKYSNLYIYILPGYMMLYRIIPVQ